MKDIIKVDTIDQYNKIFGLETLHPLVAVVDLSVADKWPEHYRFNYGFYCIYLKDAKCGEITYGRQSYDYQEGSIVCFAPGQVAHVNMPPNSRPSGIGVLFHQELIRNTPLAAEIGRYGFFDYEANEALHLSERERKIILDCIDKIKFEISRDIDKHTQRLIATNIELLLDYCMRFYDRQFITRSNVNRDVVVQFEKELNVWFDDEKTRRSGLPMVKYFADKACLSPNYFGDVVKKDTGMTAQEYIQLKMLNVAKDYIAGTNLSISQIAYELGFQYPQHFTRVFKKFTGLTPVEYRREHAS